MKQYFKVVLWGLWISALGTVPLGVLNVTALQLAIEVGAAAAWQFALGAALIEVLYARFLLVGMQKLLRYTHLLKYMDWLAFIIVAALATASIWAAINPNPTQEESVISSTVGSKPFLFGLVLSACNPMQIPYWFGWSTVLISTKKLEQQASHYNWYTVGIGIGTMAGLALFIIGGPYLSSVLSHAQTTIQWAVSIVLTITAIIFLYRILANKGSSQSLQKKIKNTNT